MTDVGSSNANQTSQQRPGDQASEKLQDWWRGKSIFERYGRIITALIFWGYFFLQTLVFDLDGFLIRQVPPALEWIIVWKSLVFLVVAAALIYFVSPKRRWSVALYVLVFPFAIIGKVLFNFLKVLVIVLVALKSWPLAFAVTNAIFEVFEAWKLKFLLYVITFVSIVVTFRASSPLLLNAAAVMVTIVIAVLVGRKLMAIFQPTPIFNFYVRAISWSADQGRRRFIDTANLRGIEITALTSPEYQKPLSGLTTAFVMAAICDFFEERFLEYRKSHAAIVTYLLSLLALLLMVIFLLTIANLAVYRANVQSFTLSGGASFFDFFYYSFGLITGQRGDEIKAVLFGAKMLSMIGTVLNWLFLAGTLLSLYFSIKRTGEEEAINKAVARLQEEKSRIHRYVEQEFSLPIDEAIQVLEKAGSSIFKLTEFLRKARGG